MPKAKISRRTVEALEPGAKRFVLWDSEIAGFGVRVSPGGAKMYFYQYRPRGAGRAVPARTENLGRHGMLAPQQARDMALALAAQVRAGGDPQRERGAHLAQPTVRDLALLYLEDCRRRKVKGIVDLRSILKNHIVPALGRLRVPDVRKADVVELKEKLEAAGKARMAGRVVQTLRAMFNRAEREEKPWQQMRAPGTNPCRHIEDYDRGRRRRRFLAPDEVRRGLLALEAMIREGDNPWAGGLILLLLLTGARRNELQRLRRDKLDRGRGVAIIEDSKTGYKEIQIGPRAWQVVDAVPAMPGNPYLICGVKDGQHLQDPRRYMQRWLERAELSNVTFHDFRRTFVSMAGAAGLTLEQTAQIVEHKDVATTRRYAFLHDQAKRLGAAQIEAAFFELLEEES